MIKLEKGDEPEILEKKSGAWTAELLGILDAGGEPTTYQKGRYNTPEVKLAVITETFGKCAYCESKVLHVAFGDIEHILPKSERPDLSFEWTNLTLACSICNNRKRAYHDEELPLLDPYQDEVEERLLFFGPLARAATGDVNALMTERTLDLNRELLIERRTERLDHLLKLLEVVKGAPDGLREILEDDFRRELGADKEYASLSRTIARTCGIVVDP